jgi:protein SCO1/2
MKQLLRERTVRVAIICVLALAVAGTIAAYVARKSEKQFGGTDISAVQWARGFDLTDHTGRRRTLADFRGKVVLMFFGYTNCPDACPLALAEMAQVVKQLGPAGDGVQGLFITVDPERDTAERLAAYVPAFDPSFLGLRGSTSETQQVASEFKIFFQAQKARASDHSSHGAEHGSYMVDHSTGIYAFDRQGRVRLHFSASSRTVERMIRDVELLLEQQR